MNLQQLINSIPTGVTYIHTSGNTAIIISKDDDGNITMYSKRRA